MRSVHQASRDTERQTRILWNCDALASFEIATNEQTSSCARQTQRQSDGTRRSTSRRNGRGTAKGKTKNDEQKKEKEEDMKIQLKNTAEEG